MDCEIVTNPERILALLENQALFRDIEPKHLKSLKECHFCTAVAGERIPIYEGDGKQKTYFLYIIQSGYVTVRNRTKYQKDFKGMELEEADRSSNNIYSFTAWRGKGQIFGEGSMVRSLMTEKDGYPISYYPPSGLGRIHATDLCVFLRIAHADFLMLAEIAPLIYRNLAVDFSDKLIRERIRSEAIQTEGKATLVPVARTLNNLYELRGARDGTKILKGMIRTDDIAGYLGIDSATVREQLQTLRENKIIDYHRDVLRLRGEIAIEDANLLKAACYLENWSKMKDGKEVKWKLIKPEHESEDS